MYVKKNKIKTKAFTLIEMVLTTVLISIISVVIGRILFSSYSNMLTSENISNADWNAFVALEKITNDVHKIRSSADMTTIAASNLVFIDVDGASVQLQLSGSDLLRNSKTLATGISGLTFGYLDYNGAATATASSVRYITVSITSAQNNISATFSTLIGTRGMT